MNQHESALKTNPSLEFAVLTGCLRISKESIFTGLNNLNVYSVINHDFSEYFGFTADEVTTLAENYILPSIANNIVVCNAAKSGCKAIGFAKAV